MKKTILIILVLICATALLFFCNSSKSEAPLSTHSIIKNLKDSLR